MALLNPMSALVAPFLFFITVPLAIFAGITTTVAFAILVCRVMFVYLNIAVSIVNQSLLGFKMPSHLRQAAAQSDSPSPALTSMHTRRRRRRRSSVTVLSGGTITPVTDVGLGLTPSIGADRDFEGIGGWRTGNDEIWTTINSRLELPDRQHIRNHHRSPSGGPTTPGEGGYLMMKRRTRSPEDAPNKPSASPNSSRTRTPPASRFTFIPTPTQTDGYFSITMSSKTNSKRSTPQAVQ